MDLKVMASDLARDAIRQHEEGVQFAVDILKGAIDEEGKAARKNHIQLAFRPFHSGAGEGTIVSIVDKTPGQKPRHWVEILVATQQDKLACSADAVATPVGFTTKAMTIIEDEDGTKYGSELWEKNTAVAVQ